MLTGDALTNLRSLSDGSVQCVVTSPPYFGLRDYGMAGQIGLEPTPDAFVSALVEVFREVRRVLRDDGTCWLNLGDSYAGGGGFSGNAPSASSSKSGKYGNAGALKAGGIKPSGVLKQKDLLMIPAQAALALQADGWWLRSDIIWVKNNPMPESTTDRPSSAHEHVFLLTKSSSYFYDHEAIREAAAPESAARYGYGFGGKKSLELNATVKRTAVVGDRTADGTRNARNVWNINAAPFRGAHFATFPPELARRCIAAGSSEVGACHACGAPFARIVEKGAPDLELQRRSGGDAEGQYYGQSVKDHDAAGVQNASDVKRRILAGMVERRTVAWEPTCKCPSAYPVPCAVLDPFAGAFTTSLVAERMGRDSIGIELNPAYVELGRGRLESALPGVRVE